MNKRDSLRQKVWLKYNKHCGYCGKVLEYKDMQVDHITPKEIYNWKILGERFRMNSFDNLMPSCRSCNHYKRAEGLEGFRQLMKTLHERIQGLYIGKVAINYGIIEIKPFGGIFYFEMSGSEIL